MVSFCLVVDSHPCSHLFCFERLRLCWCKVRQLTRGGLRCVFVDTVHSSRLCLKDGTIVSFFVSSLTDDIFVLKYSAYIQTSRSSPPLQWPPVLVGNPKENICVNTSIGSQTYVKPAARLNSSRLSLSAIPC